METLPVAAPRWRENDVCIPAIAITSWEEIVIKVFKDVAESLRSCV